MPNCRIFAEMKRGALNDEEQKRSAVIASWMRLVPHLGIAIPHDVTTF